jgi:hypothetical protein
MIMEMWELLIYRQWTHILEWRYAHQYFWVRHFFYYEKIITARMHARGNDDVDNQTSDEMTRKMGIRTNRATTHP